MGRCDVVLVGYEDEENLGLRSIAAALTRAGVGVEIVACTPGANEQVLLRIRACDPRLVGFSLIFQGMLPQFAELVALLRSRGVSAHFTMGGHFPTIAWRETLEAIPGLDTSKLLVFGGWESASRGAGVTMQMVGERLGVVDQFQGVDELKIGGDGALEIFERVEGGRHLISRCVGPPALLGWATGNRPEPRNNPQVGMANMRGILPALQRAKPAALGNTGAAFLQVSLPKQQRETRIVKNLSPAEIARELAAWISGD